MWNKPCHFNDAVCYGFISYLELNYFNTQRCVCIFVFMCVCQPTGVLGSRELFVWHWWKKLWVFVRLWLFAIRCVCVWERGLFSWLYSRLLYRVSSILFSVAVCRTSPLSGRTALQLWLCSFTPTWHNIQHTGVPHASSQTEKSRPIHTCTYCSNAHQFKMGLGVDVET